jgi:intracellular sulfur oxidation DsrE/DsrF family protein
MFKQPLITGLMTAAICLSSYPLFAEETTDAVAAPATEASAPAVTNTDAQSRYGKQKVVYHINYDDPKQLSVALRNIQNHINAVGADNLDLKVIMHGAGVSLLKLANEDMDFQSKVINLKSQAVGFQVCNNTLVGKQLDYEQDLFDVQSADIIPSGVAELAYLQQQGYVYIKP